MKQVRNMGLVAASFLCIGGFTSSAFAAAIVGYEVRGGGCLNPECAVEFDDYPELGDEIFPLEDEVSITKEFLRTESTPEDEVEHGGGGNKGGRDGQIGPPQNGGGHEDEHEEEFSRLPPINVFLTLENTGQTNSYTFTENIINETGQEWLGFFHALRRNEAGLASFLESPSPESDIFNMTTLSGEHESTTPPLVALQWTDGPLANGGSAAFNYGASFADCVEGETCSDQLGDGYVVNLQQFPLVAPEAIPEPGTLGLVGIGLAGLVFARRRRGTA